MGETSAGVEIRQLRKRFTGGDHDAVDGVDLSVREGELLVLLGPSGCGKTTLLRMIAGLEHPSAGEIYIGGRRVEGTVPPRARGIAMVFQSYALYPHRTVFGNIAFPLEAARLARGHHGESPLGRRPVRDRRLSGALSAPALGWGAPARRAVPCAGARPAGISAR